MCRNNNAHHACRASLIAVCGRRRWLQGRIMAVPTCHDRLCSKFLGVSLNSPKALLYFDINVANGLANAAAFRRQHEHHITLSAYRSRLIPNSVLHLQHLADFHMAWTTPLKVCGRHTGLRMFSKYRQARAVKAVWQISRHVFETSGLYSLSLPTPVLGTLTSMG